LAEAIRAAVSAEQFRVLHRLSVEDAEPLLAHGLVQACVMDLDLTGVQGIWTLEKLRRHLPNAPLIIFTSSKQGEWEEEAYLRGASQILNKPFRPRLFSAVLERLVNHAPGMESAAITAAAPVPAIPSALTRSAFDTTTFSAAAPAGGSSTLMVLRSFSGILSHSLDAEGILRQFLLLLREVLGLNRAVVFLRSPTSDAGAGLATSRNLRAFSSIGISPGLLEHLELSLDNGIGKQVFRL